MVSGIPHHYAMLGLPSDAEPEAVKRAWKRAAARWHPDLHRGVSQARFEAAREAWDVLSDPARRAAYDAELQGSVDRAVAAMNRLQGTQRLGGVVSRVLGVRMAEAEAGRNRRLRLAVSLGQAVRGTEVDVELEAEAKCDACDATGASELGRTWVCDACGGIGEVLEHGMLRSSWSGCARCRGLGWAAAPRCDTCGGGGTIAGARTWRVPIPAGSRAGQVLRVVGAGEPSTTNGPPGDLLVELDVRPDPFLVVSGNDVRCERPVPFWVALAGGRVEVPTLEGTARIYIPPGTRAGEVLRMTGFGLETGKSKGDQLVTIRLEWPDGLDLDDAARLKAWAESLPRDTFAESAAFDARLAARSGERS